MNKVDYLIYINLKEREDRNKQTLLEIEKLKNAGFKFNNIARLNAIKNYPSFKKKGY